MKEPKEISHHWTFNITVPNDSPDDGKAYRPQSFNLYLGVEAPTMETALETIRKECPSATIWQCNHRGKCHFRANAEFSQPRNEA